jgi:hypothetical protein
MTTTLISVHQCVCVVRDMCYCAYALTTLINQESRGNQSTFKERPFTVQMHKGELCLLLLFDFIAQCVCMWVLRPARDASASARPERGQFDASIWRIKVLERALLSKICTVQSWLVCVTSVTSQTKRLAVFSKGFQLRNCSIYRGVIQNVVVYIKERIYKYVSVCPACRHFIFQYLFVFALNWVASKFHESVCEVFPSDIPISCTHVATTILAK